MARDITDAEKLALETLIDACGLTDVLDVIGEICHGKADHIREAWQDETLASEWNGLGKSVDAITYNAARKGL
jgi:hypothetical protein